MTTDQSRLLRRPVARRRPAGPVAAPTMAGVVLAALVALAAGCGSDGDAWGSGVEGRPGAADGAGHERAQDTIASVAFGDPGEVTGFEGVAEEEALDLSPPALPEVNEPVLTGPEEAGGSAVDGPTVPPGEEILDAVEPIDRAPGPAEQGELRDGHRRNEAGDLVVLDEAAALACGLVEVALSELDTGDGTAADERVRAAAEHAAGSELAPITAWSATLLAAADDGPADPTPLLQFLTVCVDGGYEL